MAGFDLVRNATCTMGYTKAASTTPPSDSEELTRALTAPTTAPTGISARILYNPAGNGYFIGWSTAASGARSGGPADLFGLSIKQGLQLQDGTKFVPLLAGNTLAPGTYDVTLQIPEAGKVAWSIVQVEHVRGESNILPNPSMATVDATPSGPLTNLEITSNGSTDELRALAFTVEPPSTTPIFPVPHRSRHSNAGIVETWFLDTDGSKTYVNAWVPPGYADSSSNVWAILSHGSGNDAYEFTRNYNANPAQPLSDLFMSHGITVLTANNTPVGGSTDCFGNAQCITDMVNETMFFSNALVLASTGYGLCDSMGCLAMLNAVAQGKIELKGIIGFSPNTNLGVDWTLRVGDNAIAAAYGFKVTKSGDLSDPEYSTATAGYDPQISAATSGPEQARLAAVPMLFFASDADTVVPKASNAALFATTLNQAGGRVQLVNTTGNHEDPSNFQGLTVLNWIASH